MGTENTPEWAIDEALRRCGIDPEQKPFAVWRDGTYAKAVALFAAHIAEYEEPPVEPLLVEAREIASAWCVTIEGGEAVAAGGADESVPVRLALAALKRGIELGQSK